MVGWSFGNVVLYVPHHANGDTGHPDCEVGVVSSTNDTFVFVKRLKDVMSAGFAGVTAQAVYPENLRHLSPKIPDSFIQESLGDLLRLYFTQASDFSDDYKWGENEVKHDAVRVLSRARHAMGHTSAPLPLCHTCEGKGYFGNPALSCALCHGSGYRQNNTEE